MKNPNQHGEQPPPGLIDASRMADLSDDLGEGLDEVIETYLEETPKVIASMRAALSERDWETMGRNAHSLKSSSGIFGAAEMVNLCRTVEGDGSASLNEKLPGELEARVNAIAAAFQKLADVLNLYLKSRKESRPRSQD